MNWGGGTFFGGVFIKGNGEGGELKKICNWVEWVYLCGTLL